MSKMVDKNGGQKYERYFDYISNHIISILYVP